MNAIWRRKGLRALLMVLPLVLVVVFPVVGLVSLNLLPAAESAARPETIRALLNGEDMGYRQFWMSAFTTLLCPLFFLCVPVLCAVITASCSFISEKENNTLETLFLTAMDAKSIFNAKITACTLISVIISLISFVVFLITVSVVDLLLGAPYFLSLEWLITALLLTPALALFSVVFVSLILHRVASTGEALQTMGYLILPLVLLYLGQFSGAFRIGPLLLLILTVLLLAASIVLFNFSAQKFQAENF